MITFLSKFFIKEKEDKGKIRQEYGILCGMVGFSVANFLQERSAIRSL